MATSFEESSQSSVQYVSSCESLQPYSPPTANVCNSGWLSGAQESVNHWGIRINSPSAFEGGHTCSCLTHFCCKALVVTLRDKKQPPKDFSFTLFPVFILFLYCTIWEQKIHFLSLTLFPPKHMSTPLLPLYLSFLCIASSFSTSPWQREGHVVLFRWEHLEVAYCSSYLFNLFTLFCFYFSLFLSFHSPQPVESDTWSSGFWSYCKFLLLNEEYSPYCYSAFALWGHVGFSLNFITSLKLIEAACR